MNIFQVRKKRLFYTFLISYILLLTIPLFIYTASFVSTSYKLQEGLNEEYLKSLVQLQTIVDKKLTEIESLSAMIGWDQRISKIYNMQGTLEPAHIYTLKEIIEDFRTLKASNTYIKDLFVYFRNNDFIVNNDGKFTPDEFYRLYCSNGDLSYDEWYALIRQVHHTAYSNNDFMEGKAGSNATYFLQSFPFAVKTGNPQATLVVALNRDEMASTLQSMQWIKESDILVINEKNQLVSSTGNLPLPDFVSYESLESGENIFYKKTSGDNLVVLFTESRICPWKYVIVMPTGIFLKNMELLNTTIFIGISFCLLFGGVTAFYFARRNTAPVSKMIASISEKLGMSDKKIANEYDFISDTLTQVIDEKAQISARLSQHTDILRNNFLIRMLKGRVDIQNISDDLAHFGIIFPHPHFAVLLFDIEESGSIFDMKQEKDRLLAFFVVRNVMEELFSSSAVTYYTDADNVLYCILNTPVSTQEELEAQIEPALETGRAFLERHFSLLCSVAVSCISNNASGIHTAYQEALEAQDYRILLGNRKVLYYSETKSEPAEGPLQLYPPESQQKFMNYIKAGSYNEALTLMNSILEQIFQAPGLSTDMAKCLMFSIINTLLNAIAEVSHGTNTGFWDELNAFQRLMHCGTLQETKEEMNALLSQVEGFMTTDTTAQEGIKNERIHKIRKYVEQHYGDENLSVSHISQEFAMNQSYLSRMFKEQTGEGVLDFITRIRLEKARKLLLTSGLSIKDAGTRTGFYNSNAFIRSFKRYYGITPGQYREIYGDKQNSGNS